jgi:hypothetical protein
VQEKLNIGVMQGFPLKGDLAEPPFGLKPCCPPINSMLVKSMARNDADPNNFNLYGIQFTGNVPASNYFDTIYQNYAAYIKAYYPAINNVVVGCYVTEVANTPNYPPIGPLLDYTFRAYTNNTTTINPPTFSLRNCSGVA